MQLGMVGLGRMGANIVRRLMARRARVRRLRRQPGSEAGARAGGRDRRRVAGRLRRQAVERRAPPGSWCRPRSPGEVVNELAARMEPGDIVIDGGNSYYRDDVDRAEALEPTGIHYVDVGTSGGVFGLERGFCLMIGGEPGAGRAPRPDLQDARPGRRERRPGRPAAAGSRRPPSRATCTAGPRAPATS